MSYPPYAGVDTYGQPLVDAWWTRGWTSQDPDYLVAPSPTSPWPGAPDVTYIDVTHLYFDMDGSPLTGFLTFMPLTNVSITQSGTTWRLPARLSGTTTISPYLTGWGWRQDSSGSIYLFRGQLYVSLMQTDASGMTTDSGDPLTYLVIEHFSGGRKFQISVPGDTTSPADLDSLMISGTLEPYIYDPTNVLADEHVATIGYSALNPPATTFSESVTNVTSVTVTHNLNCYPSVIVTNPSGNVVQANVQYINSNSVLVTFSSAFTGLIVCDA
jgi:hypothetical protein